MTILDPLRPPPLFDGLPIHSQCRDCGEAMLVTNCTVHVHPTCTEVKTRLESLLVGWVSCVMSGDYESAKLTDKEIEVIVNEPPDLGSAAMRYAEWGWPVFPLKAGCGIEGCRRCTPQSPCGKKPAVPKRIGGHGFEDAKTDVARIERWWTKYPDHNIGLATGHRFDVIDIDPKHGGIQSFLELLRDKAIKESHGMVVTASGGMHIYVKRTGKGNFAALRPGIDYRGKGGYVVAPPSTLGAPGRAYGWLTDPSPIIKGDI